MKPDRSRVNKTGHLDLLTTANVDVGCGPGGPPHWLDLCVHQGVTKWKSFGNTGLVIGCGGGVGETGDRLLSRRELTGMA